MNTLSDLEVAPGPGWDIPELPADSPTDALNITGLFGKSKVEPKVQAAPVHYPDEAKGYQPPNGNWMCKCGWGNRPTVQVCINQDCKRTRKYW